MREACLNAYAHQEAPFERLVERLSPERELSRTPVFQAMFIMQNAPGGVPRAEGVSFEGVEVQSGGAMFDLTVSLGESEGGGLEGWCEYSTDIFEEETARRLAERFGRLVSEAARRAGERVSRLEVLSEAERRLVLEEWNRTERDYDRTRCVHELITERAHLHPERWRWCVRASN